MVVMVVDYLILIVFLVVVEGSEVVVEEETEVVVEEELVEGKAVITHPLITVVMEDRLFVV